MIFETEIEKKLIGNLITAPTNLYLISDLVTKEVFNDNKNAVIYETISELLISHGTFDEILLLNEVQKKNRNIDGVYFFELIEMSAIDIQTTAYLLVEKYILRELHKLSLEISTKTEAVGVDALELLSDLNNKLNSITFKLTKSDIKTVKELTMDLYEDINNRTQLKVKSIKTGYSELDNILNGGFDLPSYNLIAGRPSNGKTTLAINIINNNPDKKCLYISCDQSYLVLARRLVCCEGGFTVSTLKSVNNKITEQELLKVVNLFDKMNQRGNIFINDKFWNIDDLYLYCLAQSRRFKIDYIIIDYIQQITARRMESETLKIGYISQRLKELSRTLNIPVIALSQLNRDIETRPSKMPILSDLKASGNLEQDADVCIMMYNPAFYGMQVFPKQAILEFEGEITKNKIAVIVAKQKDGATGAVLCGYYPQYYQILGKQENPKEDLPF